MFRLACAVSRQHARACPVRDHRAVLLTPSRPHLRRGVPATPRPSPDPLPLYAPLPSSTEQLLRSSETLPGPGFRICDHDANCRPHRT